MSDDAQNKPNTFIDDDGEEQRRFEYLRAEHPESWQKPDDVDTWGDWTVKPGRPLSARHKELCRLLFLGKTNTYIAEKMELSESRVSILKSNSLIQAEIARLQDLAFERTISERLKEMGPVAANILEDILISDDANIKPALKKDTAVWILEKLSGKPKQDIDVQSSTLGGFMDMLKQMQAGDLAAGPALIDVTPAPGGESPQARPAREMTEAERWIAENL